MQRETKVKCVEVRVRARVRAGPRLHDPGPIGLDSRRPESAGPVVWVAERSAEAGWDVVEREEPAAAPATHPTLPVLGLRAE